LPLRTHRVQTQTRCVVPSMTARTFCRFGSQVLFDTLWAWLMLRPATVPLPQIAHCLDMLWISLTSLKKAPTVAETWERSNRCDSKKSGWNLVWRGSRCIYAHSSKLRRETSRSPGSRIARSRAFDSDRVFVIGSLDRRKSFLLVSGKA